MTNDSASPRLYRVEQIAQDAGISRTTVNRLMRRGALERVKIGNATRITAESYRTWIASLSRTSAA